MIRRVVALCILGIRAPFRSRLVAGLLVLLAAVVILLPLGIKGDGTPAGDLRMLLTWTLGIAFAILCAATIWSGCATVSSDIETGRHVLTAVSPARPFEIWLGRWLGLVITNAILLMAVIAAVAIQLKIKGLSSEDTAVYRRLELDQKSIDDEVASLYEQALAHDAIPEGATKEQVLKSIREDIATAHLPLDPGFSRRWVFLLKKGDAEKDLRVTFSFLSSYGTTSGCKGACKASREDGDIVAERSITEDDNGRIDFWIPAGSLTGERTVIVDFANTGNPEDGIAVLVRHTESMHVLIHDGGVIRNLFKCSVAMLSLLALLAAVGVACGTMFSFPVATFAGTALVCIAILGSSQMVEDGIESGHSHGDPNQVESVFSKFLGAFSKTISSGIASVNKPFSDVNALDRLGDSVLIESRLVLRSVLFTGVALPLAFGVLAALALKRREL